MRLRMFTTFVALLAVFPGSSCGGARHKRSAQVDLGPVELTNSTPSQRVYLGSGENVVITPTMLDHGRLQLEVAYDRREPSGEQTHLARRTVEARPGRVTSVSFDLVTLTLIPKMNQ
jgi:hypothetical protein